MAVSAHPQSPHSQSSSAENPVVRVLISALLTFTAVLGFLIALAAIVVIAYGLIYRDQVYPGVQAVGVEIGGVSAAEAQQALDIKTDEYRNSQITFRHGDQTFVTTPAEIGVTFDNEQAVARAYEFGRTGNWWSDSRDWFDSLLTGHDVGVLPVIDQNTFEAFVKTVADEVGIAPQVPSFLLSDDGVVQITPSAEGVGIDAGVTARDLRAELSVLGDGPIDITTVELEPAYTEEALEGSADHIAEIVSERFVLERGDYSWALDARGLDNVLEIATDPEDGSTDLAVNEDRLRRQISTIADSAWDDGRDARVYWNGEAFDIVPARQGWRIDVDKSVDLVAEAILAGAHSAELPIIEQPASITTEVAEDAASFGNEIAGSRFDLYWDDGETDIGGSVIAAALTFEHDPEQGTITPETDLEELTRFLSSITGNVDIEPVDADLRYINGEIEVRREESNGRAMDRAASAERIAAALEAGEMRAEIVVNDAEPEVTAAMASEIEIREMLASAETYYHGSSANRAHNVELGTQRANGALVPPGGTYSFVDSIGGDINLEAGYQPGFGIVATDGGVSTVPSVGGGVCQVSTTLFQAAFWAGMPIVERSWHLYWISTYGQPPSGITGLDAAVDTGAGLDMKFQNTTNDWIAIVASAGGGTNRFEIWGTDPGWDIDVDGPHISNRVSASGAMEYEETDQMPAGSRIQVEAAQDGFDVEITRRVHNSDGEMIDELFLNSQYRPSSNRTLIGTGS